MRRTIIVLCVVVAAVALWRWQTAEPARGGRAVFFDRVWIDHMPKGETDPMQFFFALTKQRLGVFEERTAWRGAFEMFTYETREDGEVRMRFPQTRTDDRVVYSAKACHEGDFDFCLTVRGSSRGVKRYYSRRGWEIHGGLEAAQAASAAILPAPTH
jgi:hypothetical protein